MDACDIEPRFSKVNAEKSLMRIFNRMAFSCRLKSKTRWSEGTPELDLYLKIDSSAVASGHREDETTTQENHYRRGIEQVQDGPRLPIDERSIEKFTILKYQIPN